MAPSRSGLSAVGGPEHTLEPSSGSVVLFFLSTTVLIHLWLVLVRYLVMCSGMNLFRLIVWRNCERLSVQVVHAPLSLLVLVLQWMNGTVSFESSPVHQLCRAFLGEEVLWSQFSKLFHYCVVRWEPLATVNAMLLKHIASGLEKSFPGVGQFSCAHFPVDLWLETGCTNWSVLFVVGFSCCGESSFRSGVSSPRCCQVL